MRACTYGVSMKKTDCPTVLETPKQRLLNSNSRSMMIICIGNAHQASVELRVNRIYPSKAGIASRKQKGSSSIYSPLIVDGVLGISEQHRISMPRPLYRRMAIWKCFAVYRTQSECIASKASGRIAVLFNNRLRVQENPMDKRTLSVVVVTSRFRRASRAGTIRVASR